jgi:ABC-type ATPase involved in cell division
MLKLMYGLERPSSGSVSVFGSDLARLSSSGLQAIRRHTGFVFRITGS